MNKPVAAKEFRMSESFVTGVKNASCKIFDLHLILEKFA